jgi:hypothetical protein
MVIVICITVHRSTLFFLQLRETPSPRDEESQQVAVVVASGNKKQKKKEGG